MAAAHAVWALPVKERRSKDRRSFGRRLAPAIAGSGNRARQIRSSTVVFTLIRCPLIMRLTVTGLLPWGSYWTT